VFAVIAVIALLDFCLELQPRNLLIGVFLFMSGTTWLEVSLRKNWDRIKAIMGCVFWGLGIANVLIDNWRPFGASLAILIPAWAIVLAAQVVVILTEKTVQPVKEN